MRVPINTSPISQTVRLVVAPFKLAYQLE